MKIETLRDPVCHTADSSRGRSHSSSDLIELSPMRADLKSGYYAPSIVLRSSDDAGNLLEKFPFLRHCCGVHGP
jgi:hypothetical protein